MKLKSCLKTTKALKLVEDFTEEAPDVTFVSLMTTLVQRRSYIKVKDEPKDAFEKIYGIGIYNTYSHFENSLRPWQTL